MRILLLSCVAIAAGGCTAFTPAERADGALQTTIEEPGLGVFEVVFTEPVCSMGPSGMASDIRCPGGSIEATAEHSRYWTLLGEVIDRAGRAKLEHPEWPVRLVAASPFISPGLFPALCRASESGVQVELWSGEDSGLEDLQCGQLSRRLFGQDDDGIPFEMNLLLVDYGTDDRPIELGFGSPELSEDPAVLSHESFVLARVARRSDFAQRHLCGLSALEASCTGELCTWLPEATRERYASCVQASGAIADPRLGVLFTPAEDGALEQMLQTELAGVRWRAWLQAYELLDPVLAARLADVAQTMRGFMAPPPVVLLDDDAQTDSHPPAARSLEELRRQPVVLQFAKTEAPFLSSRGEYLVLDDTVVMHDGGYARDDSGARVPRIGFSVTLRSKGVAEVFATAFERQVQGAGVRD